MLLRSTPRFLTLFAFSICFFVASTASADRRSSLAGNVLISDADDIYVFPQLTLEHRNLVSFDFYPGATLNQVLGAGVQSTPQPGNVGGGDDTNTANPNALGSFEEGTQGLASGQASMGGGALLLFGQENFAFGISTHREDIFGAAPAHFLGVGDLQLYGPGRQSAWGMLGTNGPTPGTLSPTNGGAQSASGAGGLFLEPLQLADILLGFRLDDQSSLGARLSIGQNSYSDFQRFAGGLETKDSWNTTAIGLNLGYSLRSNFQLDLGLELGLAFFSNDFTTSDNNAPNHSDSAALAPSFSLSGRAIVPLQDSVKLGVIGLVHLNSSSLTDQAGTAPNSTTSPDEAETTSLNFLIETGAGPVYELPDSTTIAAYATLGFGSSSFSADGFGTDAGVDVSTSALLLPGFKLALEHKIWDWMSFRTGASSRYNFTFQTRNFESNGTPNVSASSNYYEFLYSAGVGFHLGNFELNGTFQTPFLTNGPAILSGTSSPMWGLLNATYKF